MESQKHFLASCTKSLYNVPKHAKQPRKKKIQNYSHVFVCHRNVPEMYECENCKLKTNLKVSLTYYHNHKNLNQNPLKYAMRQCEYCDFKTYSVLLLLKHYPKCDKFKNFGDIREIIKWLECGQCTSRLPPSTSDISSKCTNCELKSKTECDWRRYSPIKPWFQCDKCEYKAKRRTHLEQHKANNVHTDIANTVWYWCDKCEFKTTWRSSLNSHMTNKHTDSASIIWHHCEKCEHKTRWKAQLQQHIINIHDTDSEDTVWYRCHKCDFKTVYKGNLKQHVYNIHTDSGNFVWHQCEKCEYRTRWKTNLKRHIANNHTESDKIVWVKCATDMH